MEPNPTKPSVLAWLPHEASPPSENAADFQSGQTFPTASAAIKEAMRDRSSKAGAGMAPWIMTEGQVYSPDQVLALHGAAVAQQDVEEEPMQGDEPWE